MKPVYGYDPVKDSIGIQAFLEDHQQQAEHAESESDDESGQPAGRGRLS